MSTARPAVSCRALALGARGLRCSNAVEISSCGRGHRARPGGGPGPGASTPRCSTWSRASRAGRSPPATAMPDASASSRRCAGLPPRRERAAGS
ncbi:hypothetical protein STRMOE7_09295 [Streptomyces sp. MOE7]|nr:hypothetical protein STRMOE7_09295 [Streptomyces sp. MOE7]